MNEYLRGYNACNRKWRENINDKIEELNEYYKKEIYPERFNWADVDITEYYDGMIEILQNLLEEKGE